MQQRGPLLIRRSPRTVSDILRVHSNGLLTLFFAKCDRRTQPMQ